MGSVVSQTLAGVATALKILALQYSSTAPLHSSQIPGRGVPVSGSNMSASGSGTPAPRDGYLTPSHGCLATGDGDMSADRSSRRGRDGTLMSGQDPRACGRRSPTLPMAGDSLSAHSGDLPVYGSGARTVREDLPDLGGENLQGLD